MIFSWIFPGRIINFGTYELLYIEIQDNEIVFILEIDNSDILTNNNWVLEELKGYSFRFQALAE
ncbi:MAG: hypothetical protein IPL49_22090 [Saprospirales bacterium]|nr:hypothetical protein [Saprospirales bacterium]